MDTERIKSLSPHGVEIKGDWGLSPSSGIDLDILRKWVITAIPNDSSAKGWHSLARKVVMRCQYSDTGSLSCARAPYMLTV